MTTTATPGNLICLYSNLLRVLFMFIGRLQKDHSRKKRRDKFLYIRNDQVMYEENTNCQFTPDNPGRWSNVIAIGV